MRPNAIVSCLFLLFHNVCCNEDNWIEPHAWSELSVVKSNRAGEDSCSCQGQSLPHKSLASIEDQLALTYFKKFVYSLFSRQKMSYGKSSQLLKRSMTFTLLPGQLDELESVQDVRDFDIMLSKILAQAQDMHLFEDGGDSYVHQGMGVRALVTDMFKDFVQLLRISEVRFMLIVLLAIAAGWIVRKRYRIPVIVIVLGGVFLYGYFYTYLECNRKLEVDAMLDVIDSHQKQPVYEEMSWYARFANYFSRQSPEAQQKEKLIKSSKLSMPFCRPDHVLIMYGSDIFLKQIEMILERATDTITKLSSGLSFPFNYIAPFALVFLVGYILKLSFKYIVSPKVWIQLMRSTSSGSVSNNQQAIHANEAGGDRLSGENLKMLLNVISASSAPQAQQQLQLPGSGVQELMEPLEAPPDTSTENKQINISKTISKEKLNVSSSSSNDKNNVSNCSADIAEEAGFTVVDDNDDDDDVNHIHNF